MIAADTSSMVAFQEGRDGDDISVIQSALQHQQLALPPAVLTELLSDPALPRSVRTLLGKLPLLDIEPGFWARAGLLRASILRLKKRARVADALIAQPASINRRPLVTRDRDFRHFAASAGLPLL
jgi:predicted nucleic acid-binding protein